MLPYLSLIHISNDLEINLGDGELRHLILTGKNGSGKTSILREIARACANSAGPDAVFAFLPANRALGPCDDGYAAILCVAKAIMKAGKAPDAPGIVLVDEIDAHLHVDMQRKVLPHLAGMFPKIQFIVTTHSPFVMSSVANAVVYDLDSRKQFEDMSAYSYEEIIENYFGIDMYAHRALALFDEYKKLVEGGEGSARLDELAQYLASYSQIHECTLAL